jgi:hypothetical protein
VAITGYTNDSVVMDDVAAVLKMASAAALPPYYATLAPLGHLNALNAIYGRLVARGYTQAQIAAWDRGAAVERCMAIVETLRLAGAAESIPDAVLKMYDSYTDKDGLLDTVLLTAGGVWAAPQDTPGTSNSGAPGFCPNQFPIRRPGLSEFGNYPDADCGGIPGPGW